MEENILIIFNSDGDQIYNNNEGKQTATKSRATKKAPAKSRNASKEDPVIINPIFASCLPFISDPFWIEIFTKASQGTFLRNYYFKDNILRYQVKTKTKTCDLAGLPPENAFYEVKKFMALASGVFSQQDKEYNKVEIEVMSTVGDTTDIRWTELRKRNQKKQAVATYVSEVAKSEGLLPEQARRLENLIMTGLEVKFITSSDITFEGKKIKHISNIYRKPDGFFEIDFSDKGKTKQKQIEEEDEDETNSKTFNPFKKWNQYWDNYIKKMHKIKEYNDRRL